MNSFNNLLRPPLHTLEELEGNNSPPLHLLLPSNIPHALLHIAPEPLFQVPPSKPHHLPRLPPNSHRVRANEHLILFHLFPFSIGGMEKGRSDTAPDGARDAAGELVHEVDREPDGEGAKDGGGPFAHGFVPEEVGDADETFEDSTCADGFATCDRERTQAERGDAEGTGFACERAVMMVVRFG